MKVPVICAIAVSVAIALAGCAGSVSGTPAVGASVVAPETTATSNTETSNTTDASGTDASGSSTGTRVDQLSEHARRRDGLDDGERSR